MLTGHLSLSVICWVEDPSSPYLFPAAFLDGSADSVTEVLGNINLVAGSDLLVSWFVGELQNELPNGKENLLMSLFPEILESGDLFIMFATFF